MSTKSNRSSGTQHNQRGVTQGNTLVDPKSGLPVAVIEDSEGNKRLAVDAKITAQVGDVIVDLDGVGPGGDSVHIVDNVTGNKQKIESDGSINANVEIDSADGDNIAIKSSTTGNELQPNLDGSVNTINKEYGNVVNNYNEVTNVASGILTNVLTYTAVNNGELRHVDVSGTNIAQYEVLVNGIVRDKTYTYFGGKLHHKFDFGRGIKFLTGNSIVIRVLHQRPDLGNFNARLHMVEG